MNKKSKNDIAGGQAVIEGVMMRHGNKIATAVRDPNKNIIIKEQTYIPISKRFKIAATPFLRGFITLIEMLIIGSKHLFFSASVAIDEDSQKNAKKNNWELPISLAISIGFVIVFFIAIPALFFTIMKNNIENTILLNFLEGIVRLSIFLIFLLSTLFMEDMRRVFMYHGAEHKTVFAWEKGVDLTIENVKQFSTKHPRCGTSFLLIVMFVSVAIFSLLGRPDFLHRIIYKLLLMPVISGISYEIIRFTGKFFDNKFIRVLSWPGLLLQNITTREPTDDQIEVAIAAMKKVI